MKLKLRKNVSDGDMIEVLAKRIACGDELIAVVHIDSLSDEIRRDIDNLEITGNGSVEATLSVPQDEKPVTITFVEPDPVVNDPWISVDSKLPEEGAYVFAKRNTLLPFVTMFHHGHFGIEGLSEVTNPTHWMPLP